MSERMKPERLAEIESDLNNYRIGNIEGLVPSLLQALKAERELLNLVEIDREHQRLEAINDVKRIAELEATIKKVEAVGFEVHDSWGVSEEFNSGWIACRAQVELALLGEAK